jgi:hypothetical protein
VEEYEGYLFFTMKMLYRSRQKIDYEQISFAWQRLPISFQKKKVIYSMDSGTGCWIRQGGEKRKLTICCTGYRYYRR